MANNRDSRGVYLSKSGVRWRAVYWFNYRKIHVGYFDSKEEAIIARRDAMEKAGIFSGVVDVDGEIWKPCRILGRDEYMVSNKGRVKSLDYNKSGREMLLKPFLSCYGYYEVLGEFIHRLVGMAFIPNPLNLPEINHIDHIRTNNSVENLEWVDRRENATHARNYGKHKVGVWKNNHGSTWMARIAINGKRLYLGNFATEEMAHQAYINKLNELGLANKYAY